VVLRGLGRGHERDSLERDGPNGRSARRYVRSGVSIGSQTPCLVPKSGSGAAAGAEVMVSGHPTLGIKVAIASGLYPLGQEAPLPAKGEQVRRPRTKGPAVRRLDQSNSLLGECHFNRLHRSDLRPGDES
jgi:hypothetical protein